MREIIIYARERQEVEARIEGTMKLQLFPKWKQFKPKACARL